MDHNEHDHPDTDLLVGWLEGGLIAPEAEPLERHLAACEECRGLLTSLAPPGPVADEAPDPFAQVPTAPAGPIPWGRWASLAAAIMLAVFSLVSRDGPPVIEHLAVGASEADLTGALRSPTGPAAELYVVTRVDRAAHLRLVAILSDSTTMQVPLDTDGNYTMEVDGTQEHRFGPYPRSIGVDEAGMPRTVRWVLVVASEQPLGDDWLVKGAVNSPADLARLVERIEEDHGAGVSSLAID